MSTAPTVFVIIYSMYGHIHTLTKQIQYGLEEQGINVKLYQVPETLSDEIREKMHAPPKLDLPVITAAELTEADGIVWGIPTRFGIMPAQIKAFLDSTGSLWSSGALSGKPTATFFSTGSQHGGQETTATNLVPYFAHHGMLYVPLGFANANMFDNSEVVGSSPWGSGTVSGSDGSRQVSDKEKEIALTQAKNFGNVVIAMQKGKLALQQSSEESPVVQEEQTTDAPAKEEQKTEAPVAKEQQPSSQPAASPESTKANKKDKKEKTPSKCFCM
ncbi:flavoprotein-like protein [Chlamydoabsidia padenii]|nr:flavoprotein-like protein [Chlamydoabsidia padenii]